MIAFLLLLACSIQIYSFQTVRLKSCLVLLVKKQYITQRNCQNHAIIYFQIFMIRMHFFKFYCHINKIEENARLTIIINYNICQRT